MRKKGYAAYILTENGRKKLLSKILPEYPNVIAHHITHEFNVSETLPPPAFNARVIAVAKNEKVQAAIVEISRSIKRPDGKIYHITISIDRKAGAKPVHSNDLVADRSKWEPIDPFVIDVMPDFVEFS